MSHCQYLEYVPAQPIRDILEHHYRAGWTQLGIASYTGVSERVQYRIISDTRPAKGWRRGHHNSDQPVLTKYGWCIPRLDQVTFDLADRIVPKLSCWHTGDPELTALYEDGA